MKAHTHTVLGNFRGENMIENIVRDGKKSIAPIHRITMPKDRLPDLTVHYHVLQCLETHLRHGTSLCSSVFKQIMVSLCLCLQSGSRIFYAFKGRKKGGRSRLPIWFSLRPLSTIIFPETSSEIAARNSGTGAGPATFCPSRRKLLP